MRFETRFDGWLVIVLVMAAIVTGVAFPAIRVLAPGSHAGPLWVAFVPLLIWLIVLPSMLPQFYEVREYGLFLRQGWRKSLIPYEALIEIQRMSDSRSAGVFSTQRILLVNRDGKRFVIAVAEEESFLIEVGKRCPQLERKAFGLGMPFAPQSIV